MSLEENKNTVRRFISEILVKGDVSKADQLIAPNYVNKSMPGQSVENFKQFVSMATKAIPDIRYNIDNIVAEGDTVAVHFTMSGTYTGSIMGSKPTGKHFTTHGMVLYRVVNGKVVEDDPCASPVLVELLGIPMPQQ
jgi:predicted ester cyclase